MRCRSGKMALKGNLPEQASLSFRQALALNPWLWEAFEGLCTLSTSCNPNVGFLLKKSVEGSIPAIDEIFPPRPPPTRRAPLEDPPVKIAPTTTGAGFFSPDVGNTGNLLRTSKSDTTSAQPSRMGPPPTLRDAAYVNTVFSPFPLFLTRYWTERHPICFIQNPISAQRVPRHPPELPTFKLHQCRVPCRPLMR